MKNCVFHLPSSFQWFLVLALGWVRGKIVARTENLPETKTFLGHLEAHSAN